MSIHETTGCWGVASAYSQSRIDEAMSNDVSVGSETATATRDWRS